MIYNLPKVKIFALTFLLLAAQCFFALSSNAQIALTAPDKVARGDAFEATVTGAPGNKYIFIWNGKKVMPRAQKDHPSGASLAKVLLPVSLDDKAAKKELLVECRDSKNKLIASSKKTITVYDKKRPVQKLTVDKKFVSPPASELERIKNDREKVRRALAQTIDGSYWELPFERPVPGGISSLFGLKRVFNGMPKGVHRGLDLRGAEGTPIKALADGKAALVDNLYYSGNTVYLNHGDGVFSAYLHMSKPLVKPGEMVKRGQIIGLVGSTGRVTGPHLHLSLFAQGQSVDPLPLLEKAVQGTEAGKVK